MQGMDAHATRTTTTGRPCRPVPSRPPVRGHAMSRACRHLNWPYLPVSSPASPLPRRRTRASLGAFLNRHGQLPQWSWQRQWRRSWTVHTYFQRPLWQRCYPTCTASGRHACGVASRGVASIATLYTCTSYLPLRSCCSDNCWCLFPDGVTTSSR